MNPAKDATAAPELIEIVAMLTVARAFLKINDENIVRAS
jgi:hypothetical protein